MDDPVEREKAHQIERLDETRRETESRLQTFPPEQIVYPAAGWRVKDIIAHLTAWEADVVTSLRAYLNGDEYRIPDFDEDAYNEQVFRKHYDVPVEHLRAGWQTVRHDLKNAIEAVPAEQFNGQIMCPWGLYSGLEGIVNDMIGHEAEHLRDILNAAT